MATRQCGSRKKGGVYAEVATSPDGMPLEYFIADPPVQVDLDALGITPRGVHLIARYESTDKIEAGSRTVVTDDEDLITAPEFEAPEDAVFHIFDVVGVDNYPNVLDVIEEGRALGFSRRCELPDYSRLTEDSRLILIHKRAMIRNYEECVSHLFQEERAAFQCPREVWMDRIGRAPANDENVHRLSDLQEMCAGLWKYDLTNAEPMNHDAMHDPGDFFPSPGSHVRSLECGARYYGWPTPEGVEPQYEYAIFMSLPIGRLVVIEDPDDLTHVKKLKRARKANLTVDLVTE
jgi:hypothetical protein